MDPQVLIALFGLLSSLHTNQTNSQLSAEQRQWSEQMQDKQNEYNTPALQVQRLREAGISPSSLSMGNGMQVTGNTSAPVNQYEIPQMLDPMSLASNSLLSVMSANKARAEAKTEDDSREVRIAEIKGQMEVYREQVAMLQLDQRGQQIANEYAAVMNEVAVAKDLSEIGLNDANVRHLDSLTETNLYKLRECLPKEVQLLVDQHKLNVLEQDKVVAEIEKLLQEKENLTYERELIRQETYTEMDKQETLSAQGDEAIQRAEYVKNQIKLFLDTYDDVANQVANESKLSNRQVKAFWINTILHGSKESAVSAGAVLGGAAAAAKAGAALAGL